MLIKEEEGEGPEELWLCVRLWVKSGRVECGTYVYLSTDVREKACWRMIIRHRVRVDETLLWWRSESGIKLSGRWQLMIAMS